jgi:hypothetical protein
MIVILIQDEKKIDLTISIALIYGRPVSRRIPCHSPVRITTVFSICKIKAAESPLRVTLPDHLL